VSRRWATARRVPCRTFRFAPWTSSADPLCDVSATRQSGQLAILYPRLQGFAEGRDGSGRAWRSEGGSAAWAARELRSSAAALAPDAHPRPFSPACNLVDEPSSPVQEQVATRDALFDISMFRLGRQLATAGRAGLTASTSGELR
jgi:hypothetical protein